MDYHPAIVYHMNIFFLGGLRDSTLRSFWFRNRYYRFQETARTFNRFPNNWLTLYVFGAFAAVRHPSQQSSVRRQVTVTFLVCSGDAMDAAFHDTRAPHNPIPENLSHSRTMNEWKKNRISPNHKGCRPPGVSSRLTPSHEPKIIRSIIEKAAI